MATIIFSDSIEFGQSMLPQFPGRWGPASSIHTPEINPLLNALFDSPAVYTKAIDSPLSWECIFIVESARRSQYDVLIELSRKNLPLPQPILCLAGEGRGFHGFKGRPWDSPAGNIYLSVFVAPDRVIDHFGVGFLVLTAVSVIDAIDNVPGLRDRAGIKWVNDILIDGAKVCGVLAHSQAEGRKVDHAVLGIGLNVGTTPQVKPTPFVPVVGRLIDFAPHPESCTQQVLLEGLIKALDRNYRILLDHGYRPLLESYRRRSLVINHHVVVRSDSPGADREVIAQGRVAGIGEHLELLLEGQARPVTRGRLILQLPK